MHDFAEKMSNLEGDINSKTEQLLNSHAKWIGDISYGYGDELADDVDKQFIVKF